MPLATGNKWEYETISYNYDGSVNDTSTMVYNVLNPVDSLDNKGFYFDKDLVYFSSNNPVTNKTNGFWIAACRKFLAFKYPAKRGNHYLHSYTFKYPSLVVVIENGDTSNKIIDVETQLIYDFKVLSTNETVQTPAGKFKAYVYELNMCMDNLSDENVVNRYFKFKYFIAPNIGIVKINYYYEQNNLESDFKLWSENYLAHYELY